MSEEIKQPEAEETVETPEVEQETAAEEQADKLFALLQSKKML